MIYNNPQRHTGVGTAKMIQRSSPHPVILFSLRLPPPHLFYSLLSAVAPGSTSIFTGAHLSSGNFHKAYNEDIINHIVFFPFSTVVSLEIINTDIAQGVSLKRREQSQKIIGFLSFKMLLGGYSIEYTFPDNGKESFWFDKI